MVTEAQRRAMKKWREKNRGKLLDYDKERNKLRRGYLREYNKRKRELYKDSISKYQKEYYKKIRLKIIELLGNKCSNPNCPISPEKMDLRVLQIDHIHGGGTKKLKSPRQEYKRILLAIQSGSKDYQILCVNCNWVKRYENNEI